MNDYSDESTPKRRKVRKGTHSCWECRRRKVKCIFTSSEDAICITCQRRGAKCVSQVDLDEPDMSENSSGITRRRAKFGGVQVGEGDGNNQPAGFSTFSAPALTLHRHYEERAASRRHDKPRECQPSLPVIPRAAPTPPPSNLDITEPKTHRNITQALVRALPCRTDIEILLGKVTRVSVLCYRSNYKCHYLPHNEMPKEQIRTANLLHPEAHPVLLARQMLLFAAAMQYLCPTKMIPGLTEPHHVIRERLAESAILMVTTNDSLLGSLEGLEAIILEGFYHIDSGNIRRAWITQRRAVMAAQLLGLHRPGHYRFKILNDHNDLDPEVMWDSIVCMERVLSLLLGLPTSTDPANPPVKEARSISVQEQKLPHLLMGITARILERNKIGNLQQAIAVSREIDRELVKITEQMSPTFWRPPAFAGLKIDSVDAFWEARRTWEQMCYYILVNQLHLPYMMCPKNESQFVYSKIACVNASREILNLQIAVRTFNPITACCRMGDFMALIAGLTLMLAHIVSHCHKEMDNLLIHQRLADRATVERTLECMQSMSELQEDVLAAKCATLLKDLLAVEADAAQAQNYCARRVEWDNSDHGDDGMALIIKVPYVGAIRIAREGVTSEPFRVAPPRALHEEVTIGGIGSLHVNTPKLQDQSPSDLSSDAAPSQVAPMPATIPPPTQSQPAFGSQFASGDSFLQQDPIFPDAAANMDDWVFQGFDTAFFDVLMRGAENQGDASHTQS